MSTQSKKFNTCVREILSDPNIIRFGFSATTSDIHNVVLPIIDNRMKNTVVNPQNSICSVLQSINKKGYVNNPLTGQRRMIDVDKGTKPFTYTFK